MAKIDSGNWSYREPPFKDGDEIRGGNYQQAVPGTAICAGVKNLKIRGGNFVNCVKQPTWDVKGGNWSQLSRCSHLHPELVAHGLPPCGEDCEHAVGHGPAWVGVTPEEYLAVKAVNQGAARVKIETDENGLYAGQLCEVHKRVYEDKVL